MKDRFKFRWERVSILAIYVLMAAYLISAYTGKVGQKPRTVIAVLLAASVGFWCLYMHVRSLKTGRISYRIVVCETYDRRNTPFWYWFYTGAAGFCALVILTAVFLVATGLWSP